MTKYLFYPLYPYQTPSWIFLPTKKERKSRSTKEIKPTKLLTPFHHWPKSTFFNGDLMGTEAPVTRGPLGLSCLDCMGKTVWHSLKITIVSKKEIRVVQIYIYRYFHRKHRSFLAAYVGRYLDLLICVYRYEIDNSHSQLAVDDHGFHLDTCLCIEINDKVYRVIF